MSKTGVVGRAMKMAAKVKKLESKSAPGPWRWWDREDGRPVKYDLARILTAEGHWVISLYGDRGSKVPNEWKLLVEARNFAPVAIAALEEQAARIKGLEKWIDELIPKVRD